MHRLLVVSAALLASTGCFQADTHITLAPDGSGVFVASSHFTPAATKALRQLDALQPDQHGLAKIEEALPHRPSRAEKKALAAAGLHAVKVTVEDSEKWLGADLSLKFDTVAALAALSTISGSGVPHVTLAGTPQATTFKLQTTPPAADGAPAAPAEMSPEVASKAGAIVSALMAEAGNFHVTVVLDVPGTITASTPDFGAASGGTVTWTVDATMMMARMGSLDPTKLGADGYAVTFTPAQPFPDGVVEPEPPVGP